MPSTESNKAVVRRLYDECVNGGRTDLMAELVGPDFSLPDGSRGPAAFAANVAALRQGFPDLRFTIQELVAEGDRVAARWTWTGTHTGTFRGFAASGRRVRDTGIVIYTLAGGRVAGAALETDRLGVLQQIGVLPADLKTLATAR